MIKAKSDVDGTRKPSKSTNDVRSRRSSNSSSTSLEHEFSSWRLSQIARSGSHSLLLALDLLPTYHSSLGMLYEKYFNNKDQLAVMRQVFNDHTMQDLRPKDNGRIQCPFRKGKLQKSDVIFKSDPPHYSPPRVRSLQLSPAKPQEKDQEPFHKIKNHLDDDVHPLPEELSVPLKGDHEDTSSIFPTLVLERGLTLWSFGGDVVDDRQKNESIQKAQSEMKFRDQNQQIGDSFAHFLKLYLEYLWSDSSTNLREKDSFDELLVENFIKYLKVLHSEYLSGTYKDPNMADLDSSEDSVHLSGYVHGSHDDEIENDEKKITMDEYRIFVEYTCYLLEMKVLRQNADFKESDLVLISSLRYHLTKLSLYFLGELPLSALVKDTGKSTTLVLRRMYTISKSVKRAVPRFFRRASKKSVARFKRMASRRI